MQQYLPFLVLPPLLFVIMLVLIWIIGFITGWRRLARLYPQPRTLGDEKKFYLKSISIGRCGGYNNCVTIGISEQGMSLSQLFFFRIGHPPIFIPWEDVVAEKLRIFKLFPAIRLVLVRHPKRSLILQPGLCNQLAKAAGDYWPKIEEIA